MHDVAEPSRPVAAPVRGAGLAALAAVLVQAGLVVGGAWAGEAPRPQHGGLDASFGPLGSALGSLDAGWSSGARLVRRLLVHAGFASIATLAFLRVLSARRATLAGVVLAALPAFVPHIAGPYSDVPVVATTLALLAVIALRPRLDDADRATHRARAGIAWIAVGLSTLAWRPAAWLAVPLAIVAWNDRHRWLAGALVAAAAGAALLRLPDGPRIVPEFSSIPSLFAAGFARVGDAWGPAAVFGAVATLVVAASALARRRDRLLGIAFLASMLAAMPWPFYGEPAALGARIAPFAFVTLAWFGRAFGPREPLAIGALGVLALAALVATQRAIPAWRSGADAFASAGDDGYATIQRARALLADGKRDAVGRMLGDVLQRGRLYGPRRVEAALLRAAALGDDVPGQLRIETVEVARELADAATPDPRWPRGDPRVPRAESWRLRAAALAALPDPAGALDALRRAVTLDDASARVHLDLGVLLGAARGEDDRDAALRHLQRAASLDPSLLEARLAEAALHVERGEVDRATAILDAAARRHDGDPRLLHARARLELSGRRDVKRAQEILRRLRESGTGGEEGADTRRAAARLEAEIHVALGRAHVDAAEGEPKERQGRLEAALREFDLALEVEPGHWQANVFAGDAESARRRHALARERYRRALERQPDARWIRDQIARTSFLEAAWILQTKRNEIDRTAALDLVAEGIVGAHAAVDLGFAALARELPLLRALVAARRDGPAHVAAPAGDLLEAVHDLAFGREADARETVARAASALGADPAQDVVRDAALLLRAILAERSGDLGAARRAYEELAARRPDDSLPRTRVVEIGLRVALARLRTARIVPDDVDRNAAAERDAEEAADAAIALADALPDDLGAGLVAVEADMHRRRWIDALGRLNRLARAHPDAPAVHRGYGMVYLEHYTATADASLIAASDRNLREALRLDPRDVRALLDAAQLAALARDFPKAIRYAEEARRFELVPRGPARRTLVDLHLSIARYAIDNGQARPAAEAVEKARALDPSHPAPWRLEAEMLLNSIGANRERRLDDALERARRARELAPFDTATHSLIARIQRERGLVLLVRLSARPTPGVDPAAAESSRARWRADAALAFEEAIALDPDAPETDDARMRLDAVRRSDPDAQRRRVLDAQEALAEGRDHQRAGRTLDALRAYRRAAELVPSHGPAQFGIVQTTWDLLKRPGGGAGNEAERDFEDAWVKEAEAASAALDRLDVRSEFPERWLYRGLLHRFLWRRDADESRRHAARVAFERYLHLEVARGRTEGESIDAVHSWLAELSRREDG